MLKNTIIGGLACLVLAMVIGVEPLQRVINEAMNQGTLKGVETCMSYSDSELLSNDAIKAMCVSTFQKHLFHNDHATGRAGPNLSKQIVNWDGVLKNKTPDHVTTWVQISVSIYDKEGKEQEVSAETPIWIDPLNEADFRVEFPDLESKKLENLGFCDHEDAAPTECMSWGVTDVMGLAL